MRGNSPMKMAVGVTAIALFAAGCGGGSEDTADTDENAIISVAISEPQSLIPSNTNETGGSQVLAALYAPLVDYNEENEPVEVVAESIEPSDDQRVWTIKLKGDQTFHNGDPVNADSYINAWNYGAYGPNAQNNSYFWEKVDGYAATQSEDPDGDGPQEAPDPESRTLSGLAKVDDLTFTVTLAQPFSEFKAMLGYTAFYPLPAAAWESEGVLKEDFQEAPIGNGPFRMKGVWQHDQRVEVERWDDYAGDKPKIGGVEFKIYQQPTAEYADLQADNVDVVKQIPTENLATAEADLGDRFKKSPASTFQFLAFPTYQDEYSDAAVRRAISKAIDRDEIINNVFKNSQTVARSFVSPVVAGYRENTCGENCQFDPAAAKSEYEAANGPQRINITYNADGGHKDWVDATCNQLKNNLGIECVGTPEAKFADMLTKLDNKESLGMFRLGWVMDYPSMENYLGPLFSTTGSSNYYGYSNPQFDQLVQQGASAATQDEAIAAYQQAEDLLAQDMPVMPLRFGQNVFGHSTRVQNVEIDLFNRVNLMEIEAVSAN